MEEESLSDFERLFDQTSSMVYNLGWRLFQNEDDASDFTQDVYLIAYDKFHTFEGRSKASTWLYTLALRHGLAKLKKEKRLPNSDSFEVEDISEPPEDYTELWEKEEMEVIVQSELGKLPDQYRLPLTLFFFEKLSYQEMAKELGVKEGTLKSLVYRGKLILKKSIEKKLAEKKMELS